MIPVSTSESQPNRVRPDDDISLLGRIQWCDDRAIALLYDRHACVVYSMAFRVLGDATRAEQILSGIFLEIWRSPERFMQSADKLSPSLAMIARHRAVEMLLDKPASELDFASPYTLANQQERNTTREEACAAIEQFPMERRIMLDRIFFLDRPGRARRVAGELE
jgi:RNA polymerase sigma-70 factor (ECF subfamily)